MKNVMLKDWEWVINLSYRDIAVGDTELHISGLNAPDILSAIAKVYQHILDFPYTEIISIRQAKISLLDMKA